MPSDMRMIKMAARASLRALRQVVDDHDEEHHDEDAEDHDDEHDGLLDEHESTTSVRVIAIFTILLAGVIGGLIPVFIPVFRKANHPATLLLRSLAAGVILSLALIHIIPDGAADLEGLYDGPLASCMVLAGILMMVVTENLSNYYFRPQHLPTSDDKDSDDFIAEMKALSTEPGPTPAVTAYLFELGCIVHSFLIGFTLGVTVDDWATAVTLTIALVFHQALEAIGLGTVIVKARFSTLKSIIMVSTYALTVPVGIAIGMGVATSYDGKSVGALTTQGILNSISGGLLLYIALVQMLAQDFSHMTGGLLVRLGMYFMIGLGATCMMLIALYGEGDAHGH
ncbi:hypothetical protein FOA52_005319 [Chlamydomonas sp. UWO 241]|nr:hypothetical protein FOA52_005319 [Chlamydomonas sp. UWO 241]